MQVSHKVKNQRAIAKEDFQINEMDRCKMSLWELVLGAQKWCSRNYNKNKYIHELNIHKFLRLMR